MGGDFFTVYSRGWLGGRANCHWCSGAGARAVIKVPSHQHWWLVGGYDLEIGYFQRLIAWELAGG